MAAGVYASRKRLKTLFLTAEFGGQSIVSAEVQNWIGTKAISGPELARALKEHLEAYAEDMVVIKEGEKAEVIEKIEGGFLIKNSQIEYKAKTILIATGSHRRKLEAIGADKFENKGITYCASCDGPLFRDKDVAIVGGGNAGFETAAQLLSYTKSVTLFHRKPEYKADPVTVKKVLAHPRMHAVPNSDILEVKGEQFVTGIVYKNKDDNEKKELPVQGIFVEIGAIPTTDFVAHLVELTDYKQIKVDPKTQRASLSGIWAAGDCTDGLYHQNNIAAGDAVKALEDIYLYLHAK